MVKIKEFIKITLLYIRFKIFLLKLRFKKKKEIEVPKKVETTQTEEVNGNTVETSDYEKATSTATDYVAKEKAYSVVFDAHNQKWCAVELLFNFENQTFGGLKVVESNPNKQIIAERFHVLIGQNLL